MSNSTSGLTIPVKNHLKESTFYTIQVDHHDNDDNNDDHDDDDNRDKEKDKSAEDEDRCGDQPLRHSPSWTA